MVFVAGRVFGIKVFCLRWRFFCIDFVGFGGNSKVVFVCFFFSFFLTDETNFIEKIYWRIFLFVSLLCQTLTILICLQTKFFKKPNLLYRVRIQTSLRLSVLWVPPRLLLTGTALVINMFVNLSRSYFVRLSSRWFH